MTKSNHGWNVFKELYKEPLRDKVFQKEKSTVIPLRSGEEQVQIRFRDVWFSSTDYSTATDHFHPEVASEIGNRWMAKCGIPKVLQGIVNAVCFSPRVISFAATGCLKEIGDPVDDSSNEITMVRGLLMGDPLTKPILHLQNIANRASIPLILDPSRMYG